MNETREATILIVDDTPANIDLLRLLLKQDYKLKVATSGKKALEIVKGNPKPDLILLDVLMPEMDGYQVCEALKSNTSTAEIPVIFVTAQNEASSEARGFEAGGVDFITKPFHSSVVKARIKTQLELARQTRLLNRLVDEKTQEIHETRLKVIQRLGLAAEFKDNETGMHVVRMSHYARLIAQQLGYDDDYCELIFNASPMHDVGKIGIPDAVLLKPGRFEPSEWEVMKTHTTIGGRILGTDDNRLIQTARSIALTHHEQWDGSGYPCGLAGEDIPIEGRIVALADVFDALTSARPYKVGWPFDKAIKHIQEESGRHFDPQVVDAFMTSLEQVKQIMQQFIEAPEELIR